MNNTCRSEGCGEVANFQCPTCRGLGINEGSYFCSQACFKKSWSTHKPLHNQNLYDPFPRYHYTGPLRPLYPLSTKRQVPPSIGRPDYAERVDGKPMSELELKGSSTIQVLNEEEIEGVRVAGRLARQVLDAAAAAVEVGVTTDEIDRIVHEACVELHCYPSPLNYYNFPKSCCTSINEVICHGIPDQRKLRSGDICNVDVTVYHRGYHGDLNETLLVGEVGENGRRLVQNAWECLWEGIKEVRPGTKYRDIGNIIQKHAKGAGFSVVRSYCGHGIGKLFHCTPSVPHYGKNKAIGVMKNGHCFTIEPMINEGGWRDEQWPDAWTAVTTDGKLSAQFEETLIVTDSGVEVVTQRGNKMPYFLE